MNRLLRTYESALRTGSGRLVDEAGRSLRLPIADWIGPAGAGDEALLARCTGPTLDVGCGPGRLTTELQRRGCPALGIDVSPLAVAMTQSRGGTALLRDVFDPTPGEHRWNHLLLADGNIGIGGDPVRLLNRCRELLGVGGSLLVDLEPPGHQGFVGRVRLEVEGNQSSWFAWARLGVNGVDEVAAATGFVVRELWSVADRWQAELVPSADWPGRNH